MVIITLRVDTMLLLDVVRAIVLTEPEELIPSSIPLVWFSLRGMLAIDVVSEIVGGIVVSIVVWKEPGELLVVSTTKLLLENGREMEDTIEKACTDPTPGVAVARVETTSVALDASGLLLANPVILDTDGS